MSTEVWAPLGAVVVALLGYAGGRASRVVTVAAAWERLLTPYREEQERLWDRIEELERARATLTAQREIDRQELAMLRRQHNDQRVRSSTEVAVLKTTLADRGIAVPDIRPPVAPERTRSTDDPNTQRATGA